MEALAELRERYPPTHLQERWIANYTPDRFRRLHLVSAIRCTGPFDMDRFRRSVEGVAARHASLRAFIARDDRGLPWIGVADCIPVTLVDLQLADRDVHEVVDRFRLEQFDLESGPLFRVGVGCLDGDRRICVLVVHHVIADGWSLGVFWSEVLRLYQDEPERGRTVGRALAAPLQFTAELQRQKEWLASSAATLARTYWAGRLGLCRTPLVLPQGPSRRLEPGMPPVSGSLDAANCEKLVQASRLAGVPLSSVVLAAFATVLAAWGKGTDVVSWVCHTGRRRREAMQAIGSFVDMWLLSVEIVPDASPWRTVETVHSAMVEALPALSLPGVEIGKIFSELHPGVPGPAVVFNFLPTPAEGTGRIVSGSLVTEPMTVATRERYMPTQSGVTFFATVRWDKASLSWTLAFDPSVLDGATVDRASRYFGKALERIGTDSKDPLPAWCGF